MSLASQITLLAQRIATEFKNRALITMMDRGDINTSINLNTLTTPGMYRVNNAFVSAQYGLDSAYHYGVLIVYKANGAVVQEYMEDGIRNWYQRTGYGGTFSNNTWIKFSGTAVNS